MVHNSASSASSASSAAASSSNQRVTSLPLEGQKGVKRARSEELDPVHNNPNMRRLSTVHSTVAVSNAQAGSSARSINLVSLYGAGCTNLEVSSITDKDAVHSVWIITREIEINNETVQKKEYYDVDPTGKSELERLAVQETESNPSGNFVSNGIAVFGDKFVLDSRELGLRVGSGGSQGAWSAIGLGPQGPQCYGVSYSVRTITPLDGTEDIEVKTILLSVPKPFMLLRQEVVDTLDKDYERTLDDNGIDFLKSEALRTVIEGKHKDGAGGALQKLDGNYFNYNEGVNLGSEDEKEDDLLKLCADDGDGDSQSGLLGDSASVVSRTIFDEMFNEMFNVDGLLKRRHSEPPRGA
jgi:hypothetical protein